MLKQLLGLSLTPLILLSACNNPAGQGSFTAKTNFPPLTENDQKITPESKIVNANNKFGFKLFSELTKADAKGNIFISPTSISFALAMTYNGAQGETKSAMEKTLEFGGMDLAEVNKSGNALMRTLINLDSEVKLDIANSIWTRKGVELKTDFSKNNQEFYKATTASLDFADPAAPVTINKWVSDNTNQKIQKIVPEKLDSNLLMVLINAIYFKANWTDKFEKELTKNETFNLPDGKTKKTDLMHRRDKISYLKGENFQAVKLPYGKEQVSMYFFLPETGAKLEDLYKNLNAENWQKWMSEFRNEEGEIAIPKFKLEYESELNTALKALGMENAFDTQKSDFKNMFSGINGYISQVMHKTYVDVNEEGTEAAAVTSVMVGATSIMQPKEPFKFIADRPFFYAIRDEQTGTVLFMGTVNEPKY